MARWFGRRFTVGVVGCSEPDSVLRLLTALELGTKSVEIVAVADDDLELARRVARGLGAHFAFDSLEAMVGRLSLDGVIVTLPASEQARATVFALEQGMHVFCGMPFGRSPAEARRMIEAAERNQGILAAANPHLGQNRWSQKFIEKGEIGDPYLLEARLLHPASGAPPRGAGINLASHLLLAGLPLLCSPPVAVSSVGWSHRAPGAPGPQLDPDTLSLVVDCENGARGLFIAGWGGPLYQEQRLVHCHGSKGSLAVPLLLDGSDGSGLAPIVVGADGRQRRGRPPASFDEAFVAQMRSWVRRARQIREPLLSPPEYVLAVHEVLDAAYRSAAIGGDRLTI